MSEELYPDPNEFPHITMYNSSIQGVQKEFKVIRLINSMNTFGGETLNLTTGYRYEAFNLSAEEMEIISIYLIDLRDELTYADYTWLQGRIPNLSYGVEKEHI